MFEHLDDPLPAPTSREQRLLVASRVNRRRRRHRAVATALAAVTFGALTVVTLADGGENHPVLSTGDDTGRPERLVTLVPDDSGPYARRPVPAAVGTGHSNAQGAGVTVAGGEWIWVTTFDEGRTSEHAVLRVDPSTGEVRGSTSLGCAVDHAAHAGDALWVACDEELLRIDGGDPASEPERRATCGGIRALAGKGDDLWMLCHAGRSLWHLDGRTGEILSKATLARTGDGTTTGTGDRDQIVEDGRETSRYRNYGLTIGDEAVWAVVAVRLVRVDLATGQPTHWIPVGDQPAPPVAAGGYAWVLDRGDHRIVRVGEKTGKVRQYLRVPDAIDQVAASGTRLWLTSSQRTPSCSSPGDAVRLLVRHIDCSIPLSSVDATNTRVLVEATVAVPISGPVVTDGQVWATERFSGTLLLGIDPDTGSALSIVDLDTTNNDA